MFDIYEYYGLKGGEAKMANKGKGWYGDSEGHAKAGRKGGLARGKRNRQSSQDR